MDNVWKCEIGGPVGTLPGADLQMREVVENAFKYVTGKRPTAIFSGWGERWTEMQLACIENRMPAPQPLMVKVWTVDQSKPAPDTEVILSTGEGHCVRAIAGNGEWTIGAVGDAVEFIAMLGWHRWCNANEFAGLQRDPMRG